MAGQDDFARYDGRTRDVKCGKRVMHNEGSRFWEDGATGVKDPLGHVPRQTSRLTLRKLSTACYESSEVPMANFPSVLTTHSPTNLIAASPIHALTWRRLLSVTGNKSFQDTPPVGSARRKKSVAVAYFSWLAERNGDHLHIKVVSRPLLVTFDFDTLSPV